MLFFYFFFFFFSSRRRHTRSLRDWSSDVCSSDLGPGAKGAAVAVGPDAKAGVVAVGPGAKSGGVAVGEGAKGGVAAAGAGAKGGAVAVGSGAKGGGVAVGENSRSSGIAVGAGARGAAMSIGPEGNGDLSIAVGPFAISVPQGVFRMNADGSLSVQGGDAPVGPCGHGVQAGSKLDGGTLDLRGSFRCGGATVEDSTLRLGGGGASGGGRLTLFGHQFVMTYRSSG